MSINLYFCNPVRLKEPVIVKVMTTKTQQIRIEDFDYPLPDERIAKFPLPKRDESKLLLYKEGKVSESIFKHITDYLPEGSLMVFNNPGTSSVSERDRGEDRDFLSGAGRAA